MPQYGLIVIWFRVVELNLPPPIFFGLLLGQGRVYLIVSNRFGRDHTFGTRQLTDHNRGSLLLCESLLLSGQC